MSSPHELPEYDIPHEVAAHVLHEFGEIGLLPGSFTTALIAAAAKADHSNRTRLALGFPQYIEAVELIKFRDDGVDILKNIVREHAKSVAAENKGENL